MIFLFGGTTEGREIAEFFEQIHRNVKYFVATEYGEEMLGKTGFVEIVRGRKEKEEILSLLRSEKAELVLDATHPYATMVSSHLRECCEQTGIEYIRIIRKSECDSNDKEGWDFEGVLFFQDLNEIVKYLKGSAGNILLTTGSKQIREFSVLDKERIYARVLPDEESIRACVNAGIQKSHILAMQGPFSAGLNEMLLKNYRCRFLVTKESGDIGGFSEKIRGAKAAGATVLVLGRPHAETGMSVTQLKQKFDALNISILGIGPGSTKHLTKIAEEKIIQADAICGADRMISFAREFNPNCSEFSEYRPEKIVAWILERIEQGSQNIAILMSGDSGFYSGAKKLLRQLRENKIPAKIYPGISSVSLMASIIGIPWDDYHILSLHNTEKTQGEAFLYSDLILSVFEREYTFAITRGLEKNEGIMRELAASGLGDVVVYIGEELGYANQKITKDKVKNLLTHRFSKLCVLLIHNPEFRESRIVNRIPDEEFIRGRVPMTKEEIRMLSLARLNIQKGDICFDIGAGTGSVSVEMSRTARAVYAIEMKEEAVSLIRDNAIKFGISHTMMTDGLTRYRLNILHQKARDALERLPAPDCVFIGGSGGELPEIVEKCFSMNPVARVVINAVSLETIAQLCAMVRKYENLGYEAKMITVNVSKSGKIGDYHLMTAQNPVAILSLQSAKTP